MTTVVKLGGRVQQDVALAPAIAAAWGARPGTLVVVHGGGDEVSALQRALGREPRFVDGRRATEAADLDLLRMVLSGVANKRLVGALVAAGLPAVGVSGEDGALLRARTPDHLAALGRVGQVAHVATSLVTTLLGAAWLPVVSPLAADAARPGEAINVNGDDAAAALAAALQADELLLVADVAGVLAPPAGGGAPVPVACLDADEARALVTAGVARGGMAAKLDAAIAALDAGVARVRIGDVAAIEDPDRGTIITSAALSHRSTAR